MGHLAVALAGKGARRDIPFWLLVVSAWSADLVEIALRLVVPAGRAVLLSHSIPGIALIATALALCYFAVREDVGGAVVVALVASSHIAVDYITGVKPSWPGGPTIGLHLYRYPLPYFAIEFATIILCWLIYRRSMGRRRRTFWSTPAALVTLVAGQIAFTLYLTLK